MVLHKVTYSSSTCRALEEGELWKSVHAACALVVFPSSAGIMRQCCQKQVRSTARFYRPCRPRVRDQQVSTAVETNIASCYITVAAAFAKHPKSYSYNRYQLEGKA